MQTDLRDLLDRPLPGEPLPRPPHEQLLRSRRTLRRSRIQVAVTSGAVVAVAAIAVAVVPTAISTDAPPAGGDGRVTGQSTPNPSVPPQNHISHEVRVRYPVRARVVDCFTAQGVPALVTGNGGIGWEAPATLADEYAKVYTACRAQARSGEWAQTLAGFTDADWRARYQQEGETAQCLRDHNRAVPELPALAAFVDDYQHGRPWNAYDFVPTVMTGEWKELNQACPQPTPILWP